MAYWFLSFRLTKPVSHPPSRGGSPSLCRWASLDCKTSVRWPKGKRYYYYYYYYYYYHYYFYCYCYCYYYYYYYFYYCYYFYYYYYYYYYY